MIRIKSQVIRQDDMIFLTPFVEDKITTKCEVKKYNHLTQSKRKFNANNIFDIRDELIKKKIQGHVHVYIKFLDKSVNKILNGEETLKVFPKDFTNNPYKIENIQISSIYRKKIRKNTFLYCRETDFSENCISIKKPITDVLVYFDNYNGNYTSEYIFDEDYYPNWVYNETCNYINYNSDLAFQRYSIFNTKLSQPGFGFFEIIIKTTNTSYTPDEAEIIFIDENYNF